MGPKKEKTSKDTSQDQGPATPALERTLKSPTDTQTNSFTIETHVPRIIKVKAALEGEPPKPPEFHLLVLYNGFIIYEMKWIHETYIEIEDLGIDLLDPVAQQVVIDKPLVFILRAEGKSKDPDPLSNLDNRAGGTVDLMPLLLGQEELYVTVRLTTPSGENSGLKLNVHVSTEGPELKNEKIPFVLTMISAHCLPPVKDGTFYVAALGLDRVVEPMAVNFGLSLSSADATKVVWASACTGGKMMNTAYFAPREDKYIPPDVYTKDTEFCVSTYWYSTKRVLVDIQELRKRLAHPFLIEVAGVPRAGKVDVRGRFMGLVDGGVLLQPAQNSVTTCAKLKTFVEAELPEDVYPLLELPAVSGKASAREPIELIDSFGHTPYVVIKLDLPEALVPKRKLARLFDVIRFPPPPPEAKLPLNELYLEPPPEDPTVDVRKIRKEGGAQAVHKELSGLACRGAVPMNQGIKRTAANRLLTRVRTMLKQFSPGDCSYVEWQDTVTAQHAASRRAVTASFLPHPPPERPASLLAAARCRMAGDLRLADKHVELNAKVLNKHPRSLLSKTLRCLEARHDTEAKKILFQAINSQTRNRFLLWVYGALEFDKGPEGLEVAIAAFQIAVKGDYSDGTAGAIGWAGLHTLYHFEDNPRSAFVATKKMRKSYELKKEWKDFYARWVETSGEEEVFWVPGVLRLDNPLIIAAAFFLCLRCYKFSETILQCFEKGCATRGSRFNTETKVSPDIYYLRAASWLLRRQIDTALAITEAGIKRFGPSAILSQMRATCLMAGHQWDEECEAALEEAERAGSQMNSAILLQAALSGIKTDPDKALQRAARAHKATPCAHTALVIARIYARKGEVSVAERWAAVAVRFEPLLADGWAVLALLAMGDRDVDRARTMLRTARQAGPVSEDIDRQIKKIMHIVKIEELSDTMTKNLCFCNYLQPNNENSSHV